MHATSLQTDHPQTNPLQTDHSQTNDSQINPSNLKQLQPTLPQTNQFYSGISPKSNSVSVIVRSYKSAVTKHINRLKLFAGFSWQARFYDHIIRDNSEFNNITWYIRNNPEKWNDDKFYKLEIIHYETSYFNNNGSLFLFTGIIAQTKSIKKSPVLTEALPESVGILNGLPESIKCVKRK